MPSFDTAILLSSVNGFTLCDKTQELINDDEHNEWGCYEMILKICVVYKFEILYKLFRIILVGYTRLIMIIMISPNMKRNAPLCIMSIIV